MAITFNKKIGTMKVTQTRNGEPHTFDISIWQGNCLAVFTSETEDTYFLYNFFIDKKHCEQMVKQYGSLFDGKVSDIKLNLFYKSARRLLEVLIKYGYDVNGYTKREE